MDGASNSGMTTKSQFPRHTCTVSRRHEKPGACAPGSAQHAPSMVMMVVVAVAVVPAAVSTVVVAAAPMRVVAPIGATHPPMVTVSLPAWLVIDITRAGPVPDAADPHVAAAAPIPVARCPHITRTRRRHHLVARRWRRHADTQAETHLRGRRWRESCGGAPCNGERGKQCKFACLHNAPPS